MGRTEDDFVEHTEGDFNKQAEQFLARYAGEQLKGVCLPQRVKEDYELLEILSGGEDGKHFNCILRKKADGKKYLLKVKKLSEHSGLEKEMQQMQRLHAAFPESYQDIIYWIEEERECILRDYQEGCNLEEYAEAHSLSARDILEISEKICDEVSMLHLLKPPVIHRDIKPQNLILDARGEVHLIDFETARNFDADKRRDTVFFGTELTAAPEQYGYSQTDARTDIYGIGKVMEYLLTGSFAERYTGNDIMKCKIQKIIDCACSFDPAGRYANVGLLKKQIVRLKETTFDIRRWKSIIVAVAVVLAIGSVGLVFGIRNYQQQKRIEMPALLEKAVAASLGQESITVDDLEKVTRIAIVGNHIYASETSDEELEQWVGDTAFLEELAKGDLEDISVLSEMPNLKEVYVCGQRVKDITPLKNLPIERLCLCDNEIEDLTVIETLPNLKLLYISDNPIQKMPALSKLENLKYLTINDNRFPDIDFLRDSYVEELYMTEVFVDNSDYSPLKTMPYLHSLFTGMAEEAFGEVIPELKQIKLLALWEWSGDLNVVKDLTDLDWLIVTGERVDSLEGVENLRGLHGLAIDYTEITDISMITKLPKLSYLKIQGLDIEDYSCLAECKTLQTVSVDEKQKQLLEELDPDHTYVFEMD